MITIKNSKALFVKTWSRVWIFRGTFIKILVQLQHQVWMIIRHYKEFNVGFCGQKRHIFVYSYEQYYVHIVMQNTDIMCTIPKSWIPKLGHQGAICWLEKELFRPTAWLIYFLGIFFFSFFKIESWTFQHMFDLRICETFNSFRQLFFHFSKDSCIYRG